MKVQIRKRGVKKLAFVVMGLVLCAIALNLTVFHDHFDIAAVTGAERKLPIYSVDTSDKKVAISFDAAWGDEHTKPILDILDRYKVKSTFFLVEFWVDKYPDDVKEIAKRGHEIGNHSATHPDMAKISAEQITKELKGPEEKIKALTGKRPTLFRPPFGSYNNTLIDTCQANGYQVIQWSIEALDRKYNLLRRFGDGNFS